MGSTSNKATNTKTEVNTTVKKYKRAVTFTITHKAGKREFTPVNRRAKAFAEVAKLDKLTRKHLMLIKSLGFKVAESPSIKPISL